MGRLCIIIMLIMTSSCSLIYNSVADSLASPQSSGNTFTMDDDPELVKEALPFALKMYETLLQKSPKNENLYIATASGFISYANAFVDTPATMLPDSEFAKKKEMLTRAKKLYLRGRNYALKGIDLRHPGFLKSIDEGDIEKALNDMEKEDVPFLYWTAAGWLAAFSVDSFDFELATSVKTAVAIMKKALDIYESYDDGAIHEFFISYYGALPESMGGSEEKARFHFKRAVELSNGGKAGPYVSLATTISVKKQDVEEFTMLLNKALAVDIEKRPENKLANILAQQKAQWYLENKENKFLLDSE